jgi:hypothetical protein
LLKCLFQAPKRSGGGQQFPSIAQKFFLGHDSSAYFKLDGEQCHECEQESQGYVLKLGEAIRVTERGPDN